MTREIKLTKGYVAIVDDNDFERVSKFKWCALTTKNANRVYAVRTKGKKFIYLHRFIMSAPDGVDIDHKDGDGLNCCKNNLRLSTRCQNLWNTGIRSTNQSGYKGVCWHKGAHKWRSQIRVGNEKRIHLGLFENAEQAAQAYYEASMKYHGEFSRK